MVDVTGNYTTSAGTALPAGVVPRVEAIPSKPVVAVNGRMVSQRPQTATPNASTGAFTLDLIPTVDVVDEDFHYVIKGYYLDPDFYGPGEGAGRVDLFEHRLLVPTEGGSIGVLAAADRLPAVTWVLVDHTWSTTNPPRLLIPGFLYLSAHPTDPDLGTGQLWKAVP